MSKQIILAADHAGFQLKESIKKYLQGESYEVLDLGAHELVEGDDYPAYMIAAAMKIAQDITGETKAIVFGGSGNGEAMACNRLPGVRAAVWYGGNEDILKLSREHNNANILSIGARFVDENAAMKAVKIWLDTPFSGEDRHKRRIEQIDNID